MERNVGWRWLSDLDWKCCCSGSERVICVIVSGNRNCLAKATDGVWSRWHFAVTEAQDALSSNAVFIVVKCRGRQQQSNTLSCMVRYFKAAFNVALFFRKSFAAILATSSLQKRFPTSIELTSFSQIKYWVSSGSPSSLCCFYWHAKGFSFLL